MAFQDTPQRAIDRLSELYGGKAGSIDAKTLPQLYKRSALQAFIGNLPSWVPVLVLGAVAWKVLK